MNTSKIVKGVVGGGRWTTTAPIIKEDYGLYLKIEGINLPDTYEVDFSNDEHSGSSVTMIGNADGVRIPSRFIKSGKDVFAFLYHVGADYGRTVYKFRIPNKLRPDRTNEEPTPEERSVIDQTIAALNDGVSKAQDAQQSIEDMSVSATTLAEGSSATVTKTESGGVVRLEFGIPKGATGDTPTITASKTGKTTSIYVDGSEVAQIEDGTNGKNGKDGKDGTPGAKGEPGEKGDPGTDGVSPTVSVTDITGGHKVTITDKSGTKTFDVMDGDDYILTEQDKEEIADMVEVPSDWLKAFPTDTASGAVASFTDGADNLPLKSLVVNIDPVQDLSQGDPSPENVCPISGWTGAQVVRTGKNLLPMEIQSGSYSYGTTITVNPDLSITYNKPNGNGWTVNVLGTFWLPAGTYTLIEDDDSAQNGRISLKKLPSNTEIVNTRWTKRLTFTLTEATQIYADFSRAAQATDVIIKFMIFKGDTATKNDYEPYNGRSIAIGLGQTVYGGKLDVLTGELVVDRVIASVASVMNKFENEDGYYWYSTASSIGIPIISGLNAELISDRFVKATNVTAISGDGTITFYANNIIRWKEKGDLALDDYRTYLASNPFQLCYELAEPIEIQLSQNQINSLLGVNNIFADTGDSSVEYRADTRLYIKRLTDSDTDMVADSNITSGQYFMVGNDLYKATVNIASGAQVIEGTNATKVSLSEALNQIKEA